MNERIKELVEEAGFILWGNEEWGPGEGHVDWACDYKEELAKYTELIVRECLKKVEEEYKPVLEDKEMMKDTHWDGYVQCGVDSYVAIREHFFGVEE